MSNSNVSRDQEIKRELVERMVSIESKFIDAKAERDEDVKSLKQEIKDRFDETGVDPKEVVRLAKIRLREQEARTAAAELEADLATYEVLFGFATFEETVADDPLA